MTVTDKRMTTTVCGIGYFGIGKYKSSTKGKLTKSYRAWYAMLSRCYSENAQKIHPSYVDCYVTKEWFNFQVFAKWFDENYIDGFQLDKDIRVKGNKIYSPEACCFVSQQDNVIEAMAKHYIFISPSGESIKIYNMREFCTENDLSIGCMSKVNVGSRMHHKGWTKANMSNKLIKGYATKKNCRNCKFSSWDSDWDELTHRTFNYMICGKRLDESIEFENNLTRPEYLEKAKRCCELKGIR